MLAKPHRRPLGRRTTDGGRGLLASRHIHDCFQPLPNHVRVVVEGDGLDLDEPRGDERRGEIVGVPCRDLELCPRSVDGLVGADNVGGQLDVPFHEFVQGIHRAPALLLVFLGGCPFGFSTRPCTSEFDGGIRA